MKKVVHIITGLGSGGAENMLYKLIKYSNKDLYYHEVISLIDKGVMGEKIESLGVKVHSLNINFKNLFSSLIYARRICKDFDIINTWLYHADLFGFLISKILLKNKKLIWNIRHSNLDKDANKSTTLKIVKLNSKLSKYVDLITYNSNLAYKNHTKIGYKEIDTTIIPNGFELDKFSFNQSERNKLRNELLINDKERVIITVGRWNVQKDYQTLILALNEIKKKNIRFKLLMVGTNLDQNNVELMKLLKNYNLLENVLLLGRRDDIPSLLSAADVYVSSSLGESFSNSIGEAMAMELHCVVTDVGDSRKIVGENGDVVEPRDYIKMASKIETYLIKNRLNRNSNARNRVIQNYDINSVVDRFEKNFENVLL